MILARIIVAESTSYRAKKIKSKSVEILRDKLATDMPSSIICLKLSKTYNAYNDRFSINSKQLTQLVFR